MKKIFSSLLITFTLLILSNVEGKGQCSCPSGYTHTIETGYFNNGNCELEVEYCYNCDPITGYRSIYICSITIPWNQSNPFCTLGGTDIGSLQFWIDVHLSVLNTLETQSTCDEYEPCGQEPCSTATNPERFVEITQSSCFRRVENMVTQETKIIPCETEANCVTEYCVCKNDDGSLFFYKLNSYETSESGCPKRRIGIGGGVGDPSNPDPSPNSCFNPCY